MTVTLRIALILISVISFFVIVRKIRKSKIRIEDGLFWVMFSITITIFAIFPGIIYFISVRVGAKSPANILYLIIVGMLIIKLFLMSIQLSLLESKFTELTQEIALSEKEKNEPVKALKKEDSNSK